MSNCITERPTRDITFRKYENLIKSKEEIQKCRDQIYEGQHDNVTNTFNPGNWSKELPKSNWISGETEIDERFSKYPYSYNTY